MGKLASKKHLKWREIHALARSRCFPIEHPDTEEWRPVVGYESLYYVSNHGRVRKSPGSRNKPGLKSNTDGMLTATFMAIGVLCVTLINGPPGKRVRKATYVHRLVAIAFELPGQSEERFQVNHKDGNRCNNHPTNLEWVTPAENIAHAFENHLRPIEQNRKNSKLKREQVVEIKQLITDGINDTQIASKFGVNQGTITHIRQGRNWKTVPWSESKPGCSGSSSTHS